MYYFILLIILVLYYLRPLKEPFMNSVRANIRRPRRNMRIKIENTWDFLKKKFYVLLKKYDFF
uniref:Uncharacterized protein n=1 Tax=viral metagenome TaxID=1070528 RepID=A0A6C0KEV0_9ZZZZ